MVSESSAMLKVALFVPLLTCKLLTLGFEVGLQYRRDETDRQIAKVLFALGNNSRFTSSVDVLCLC